MIGKINIIEKNMWAGVQYILRSVQRKTNDDLWQVNNKPNIRHVSVNKILEWSRTHARQTDSFLTKIVIENKIIGIKGRTRII